MKQVSAGAQSRPIRGAKHANGRFLNEIGRFLCINKPTQHPIYLQS